MAIVQLLDINELNNSYENTIDFPDLDTQTSYFDSKVHTNITLPTEDFVYIRETRTIEVDKNKEELLGVNYLRYNNGNKWWYAFIINKEYINESVTSIQFEIDVIQTFMFDYTIKESYVVREHQNRWWKDINSNMLFPKYNALPENINAGETYKVKNIRQINDNILQPDMIWVEVVCTQPMTNQTIQNEDYTNDSKYLKVNGTNTGVFCYLFPYKYTKLNIRTYNQYEELVKINNDSLLPTLASSNAVLSIRILPYSPIAYTTLNQDDNNFDITFKEGPVDVPSYQTQSVHIVRTSNTNFGGIDLSGYGYWVICLENVKDSNIMKSFTNIEPISILPYTEYSQRDIERESKLYTSQYSPININNFQNEGFVLKREYIDNTNIENKIKIKTSLGVLSKSIIWCDNYLNDDNGRFNYAIDNNICELPQTNNAYISYLANNKASATTGFAVNTALDIGTNIARTIIGTAGGNPFALSNAISGASSTASNIINRNLKITDLKNTPDMISKLGNNGEFDLFKDNIKYNICELELLPQYKTIVYNFLYRYGYSCNDFKLPNIKSRYYFNYIEIQDVNLETKIDNEYIQQLKSIYSKGITFWHYHKGQQFRGINDYFYENCETSFSFSQGDN